MGLIELTADAALDEATRVIDGRRGMVVEAIRRANSQAEPMDFKGSLYIPVHERVKAFRKVFPFGRIVTKSNVDNGICTSTTEVFVLAGDISPNVEDPARPVLLATGTAVEKEGSSYINKTSFIENCVPLDTQILTRDGWKYYYQLQVGEEVWSYNMETGQNEFCKLLAVNVHDDRPIVEMASSRFAVRCTPQHKWIAKTQCKPLQKVKTEDLGNSWKILQAIEQKVEPSKIGRQLGWLMCDCDINYSSNGMASTGYISQSKHVYDVIELFGTGRPVKVYDGHWMQNFEWIVPAKTVREILGHFGMASYKDLPLAMSRADLEDVAGCYQSMMLADGSERGFSSTYPELIEAVQIMAARLGLATTFVTSRMCTKSTRPIFTIGIKKTSGAWFSELKVRNLPPQSVWCPTTENGTWFMRQNGFVTLTSNCETSAVGRALGFLGFGIDTAIASADEVQNAELQDVSKQKVDGLKVKALTTRCQKDGVDVDKLLAVCKVKSFEDLTEKTFSNVWQNWDKVVALGGKHE